MLGACAYCTKMGEQGVDVKKCAKVSYSCVVWGCSVPYVWSVRVVPDELLYVVQGIVVLL